MAAPTCLDEIVRSTAWVMEQASHVSIDTAAAEGLACVAAIQQVSKDIVEGRLSALRDVAFDTDVHYVDGGPLTVQYFIVLDALNFCFWPDGELEYEHLARSLKRQMREDASAFEASKLAALTEEELSGMLRWHRPLPQLAERARLLREVGRGLLRHYEGSAHNLVKAAGGSAAALAELVTANFPGFRDHAIFRGRQIFFYKRAQIFVADVWGAFKGEGLGHFHDIHSLTMFADYRVPVVLRQMSILHYSRALSEKVDNRTELVPGSEEEVEIRAASIQAVELLRRELEEGAVSPGDRLVPAGTCTEEGCSPPGRVLAVHLDWWLWETGEAARATAPPHHRVRTIYY